VDWEQSASAHGWTGRRHRAHLLSRRQHRVRLLALPPFRELLAQAGWPRCIVATATAGTSARFPATTTMTTPLGFARRANLYMRWEYVDRSQVHYHHLWTMNSDGSAQTVYYGNLHPGIAMLDAKPIPGTNRVVVSFSPGHGRNEHQGYVTVVDPDQGPDALESARRISKAPDCEIPGPFPRMLSRGQQEGPFPDGRAGANRAPVRSAGRQRRPGVPRAAAPGVPAARTRARCPQRHPARSWGDWCWRTSTPAARLGLPPGTVKKLLVLKQLPKPVNFSGGMQPLTIGGSFHSGPDPRHGARGGRRLGLPGSARAAIDLLRGLGPAQPGREADAQFSHRAAGRNLSCVGCHEPRTQTPRPAPTNLLAMRRGPSPWSRWRECPR